MVVTGKPLIPLLVVVGATGAGKSGLAVRLAEELHGEIISCDSVSVYREMEIGTAKPSFEDRTRVSHHLIDIVSPDQPYTAGDFSRDAREALAGIHERGRLAIVAGGTGMYLRALIDGLFPAPPPNPAFRGQLRLIAEKLGPQHLHNLLRHVDPVAADLIHFNDVSKVVRAMEVSYGANAPVTQQWQKGRDALTGYRVLRIGLDPGRDALYERINHRAAEMFDGGLIMETERLVERYGFACRALGSLGYAQAIGVLQGMYTRDVAVTLTQQGHRNYAKRQGTWFRREREVQWLQGFGGDPGIFESARSLVRQWLDEWSADLSVPRSSPF